MTSYDGPATLTLGDLQLPVRVSLDDWQIDVGNKRSGQVGGLQDSNGTFVYSDPEAAGAM